MGHNTQHIARLSVSHRGRTLRDTRRLPTGCQLPPPWFAGSLVWCQVAWLARVGAAFAWGHPRSPAVPIFPMLFNSLLRCLFGSLLACQRACLWPRPLRGLWPRGRANRSGLWDLSAAVSCRNTQGQDRSANRMGRGSQAARLQIATPHSSTVAKGKGPDPAAPRCWVSFLQQPTPRSAHALSPPLSGPLVGPVGGISDSRAPESTTCVLCRAAREHETRPCLSGSQASFVTGG